MILGFSKSRDTQEKVEACRVDYDELRRDQSLGDITPMQFVAEPHEARFV